MVKARGYSCPLPGNEGDIYINTILRCSVCTCETRLSVTNGVFILVRSVCLLQTVQRQEETTVETYIDMHGLVQ